MDRPPSFQEILRQKLGSPIQEMPDTPPPFSRPSPDLAREVTAHLTTPRLVKTPLWHQTAYGQIRRPRRKPPQKPSEPLYDRHYLEPQAQRAFNNLIERGALELEGQTHFSKSMLKSAYRRLARQLHPDRQLQRPLESDRQNAAVEFQKMREDYLRVMANITNLK